MKEKILVSLIQNKNNVFQTTTFSRKYNKFLLNRRKMSRFIVTEIKVERRCPICTRKSIENGIRNEQGDIIYLGCNANMICKNCKRFICPTHMTDKLCLDCFSP